MPLTVWQRYRPRLEALIQGAKKSRHTHQRQFMSSLVEGFWPKPQGAAAVHAAVIASYPHFHRLLKFDTSISEAINAKLDLSYTMGDMRALANKLPAITSTYLSHMKAELVQRVRRGLDLSAGTDVDLLELAASVFVPCESDDRPHLPGVLVGWKMLSAFHDDRKDYVDPLFPDPSPWLSELSRSLATLCGLDGRTTTVQDMDKDEERFFCVPCILESISSIKSLPDSGTRLWSADVFTWTAAVSGLRGTYRAPLMYQWNSSCTRTFTTTPCAYPAVRLSLVP